MEKGIAWLKEAAEVAYMPGDHTIFLNIRPEGVEGRIVWEQNGKKYSASKIVLWTFIHARPDTRNPLLSLLDHLVKERTEFET